MIRDYVLIIGAMKSGTTTLFDLLAQHPRIAAATPKEPGFFAFEDRWAEGFEWYERLFDFDPARHRYALEGSTDYTKYPYCGDVPERLQRSAPRRFKLIYIVRHPMRRFESHAKHAQIQGAELGTARSPRADHSLDAGISPVSMAASRYARQLDRFAAQARAGDLLVLAFEDLVRDQTGALGRVLEFLGLDPAPMEPAHSLPAQIRFRTPAYWRAMAGIGPLRALAKGLLPETARRQLLRRAGTRRIDLRGRFTLTPEEEASLWREIGPDCARLAREHGVDVGRLWGVDVSAMAQEGAAAAAEG